MEGLPREGEDIYFAGCYASYILPEIGKATVSVLKAAGINIAHLGEAERCCGEVLKQAGSYRLFKELAESNVAAMKKAGAKRVILSCAHGYRTWKMDYTNVVGALPFEIIHISELFSQFIDKGKIRFKKKINNNIELSPPTLLTASIFLSSTISIFIYMFLSMLINFDTPLAKNIFVISLIIIGVLLTFVFLLLGIVMSKFSKSKAYVTELKNFKDFTDTLHSVSVEIDVYDLLFEFIRRM